MWAGTRLPHTNAVVSLSNLQAGGVFERPVFVCRCVYAAGTVRYVDVFARRVMVNRGRW